MYLLLLILVRFGLIAILISAPVASGFTRLQKEEGRDHAKELTYALSALSSGTDLERTAARETLLGLGQSAIPPLLDLLKSLTPNVEVCPPGSNLPCRTGILVESNSRRTTRADVVSLLGQLHAVKAIPLLIKIMGLESSIGTGFRYSGPEKKALIEIGGPAVPELLDSLRLATERRRSFAPVEGVEHPYLEIEVRIVDVLGDIGDPKALLLLRELKESAQPFLSGHLGEAIEKIMRKTR
jgi:hypothetical protein